MSIRIPKPVRTSRRFSTPQRKKGKCSSKERTERRSPLFLRKARGLPSTFLACVQMSQQKRLFERCEKAEKANNALEWTAYTLSHFSRLDCESYSNALLMLVLASPSLQGEMTLPKALSPESGPASRSPNIIGSIITVKPATIRSPGFLAS